MEANEAIERLELIAFSLSMSGHHIHADGILEAVSPLKRMAAAQQSVQADGAYCACKEPEFNTWPVCEVCHLPESPHR